MKKYLLVSIIILFVFSIFILNEKVLATVGGPKYVSEIAYKALNNSVYYLENDYGGKGCPPIIHQINLTNNQNSGVKTCDEVFEEYFNNYSEEDTQKYRQYISNFYKNLIFIGSVSLKKNNININVSALSEYIEEGEKYWTEFRATLTQDSKEIAKIDFRGCDKDQPHIFEGYKIPNSDAMAVLISNKGDCFEGGYTKEVVHLIKGIKYYDSNIISSLKQSSATEPNLGNLTVFATSKDMVIIDNFNNPANPEINQTEIAQSSKQNQPKNLISISTILIGIVTLSVGILLGFFIGKQTSPPAK